jgi:hypothetical protein
MAKPTNIAIYGAVVIGVIFIITATKMKIYKTADPTRVYTFIYPYQAMSFSYLLLGTAFLVVSAIILLTSHYHYRTTSNEHFNNQPIPEQNEFMQSTEPQTSTPKSQQIPKSKKLEKEIHIVERYYSYSVTCPYCGNSYDDKLTQCPNCSGAKPI